MNKGMYQSSSKTLGLAEALKGYQKGKLPTENTGYNPATTLVKGDYIYGKVGIGDIYYYSESGSRVKNTGTGSGVEITPEYPFVSPGKLAGTYTGVTLRVNGIDLVQVEYTFNWKERKKSGIISVLLGNPLIGKALKLENKSAIRRDYVKAGEVTWEKDVIQEGVKGSNSNNTGGNDPADDPALPPPAGSDNTQLLMFGLIGAVAYRFLGKKRGRK